MNVRCSSCNMPWDPSHLCRDAIFDTDLKPTEVRYWRRLPADRRLSSQYRRRFANAGWRFGESIVNVVRCPYCPSAAVLNLKRAATKAALERLFGADDAKLAILFDRHML